VTQQSIVTGCLQLTDVSVVCRAFNPRSQKIWGRFLYTECTDQVNNFELIPTVKIETNISQTDHLVANVRRSIIITELWRSEFACRGKNRILGVLWKNDSLRSHLTQRRLSWGLPQYQVASWSIQPFGQNTPMLQTDRQDNDPLAYGKPLSPVYTIQPVVKPVVKPVWQPVKCLYTWHMIQPVVKPVWQPFVSCIQTFNRFDNRLDVCLHDTAGCQTVV